MDIHGNPIKVGDFVYALTTPHSGSQSKRLFGAVVLETTGRKHKVKCNENGREVSVMSTSIVKPQE